MTLPSLLLSTILPTHLSVMHNGPEMDTWYIMTLVYCLGWIPCSSCPLSHLIMGRMQWHCIMTWVTQLNPSTWQYIISLTDSPILSIPTTVGGFLHQPLVVTVTVDANPPHYNSTWHINGQILIPSNTVIVNNNTQTFTNLTEIDSANYTLQVSNGIGNKSMATFQLMTYG